jgi:diguanylate cyclase (GGDEF)-like protein/PAS domain S-box-containing protein
MNEKIEAQCYDDPEAHSEEFDRSLLRAIQEASPDGILVVDGRARVVSFNRQFLRIWGISLQRLTDSSREDGGATRDTPILLQAAQRVRDPEGFIRRVRELYADRHASDHCELELKDGRTLERHSVGMFNKRGEYLGRVWFFRDISHRKRYERELRHLATHDALTGVMNRAGFLAFARTEMQRAIRHSRPLALLMLDVDHFKQINDRYGHATGDCVLTALARLWEGALRGIDHLGRLGGEEFAVLMPDTDLAAATVVAERLRARTAAETIACEGYELSCTVSGGIALLQPEDQDIDAALGRADRALYRAKTAGRNRIEMT